MPKPLKRLHVMNSAEANRSQMHLRQARETYVPSRMKRVMREEGRIMLDFDAATTLEGRLKALDGLIRLRRLVMDMVGWPKPPTMRPGKMPAALDAIRSQDPLGDIAIDALVVRQPEPPTEG